MGKYNLHTAIVIKSGPGLKIPCHINKIWDGLNDFKSVCLNLGIMFFLKCTSLIIYLHVLICIRWSCRWGGFSVCWSAPRHGQSQITDIPNIVQTCVGLFSTDFQTGGNCTRLVCRDCTIHCSTSCRKFCAIYVLWNVSAVSAKGKNILAWLPPWLCFIRALTNSFKRHISVHLSSSLLPS